MAAGMTCFEAGVDTYGVVGGVFSLKCLSWINISIVIYRYFETLGTELQTPSLESFEG
jgi:hypothetical protein